MPEAIPSLYERADSNKRESSVVSGRALQYLQGGASSDSKRNFEMFESPFENQGDFFS